MNNMRLKNKSSPFIKKLVLDRRLRRPVVITALGALVFAVDQSMKDRIEEEPAEGLPKDMEGRAGRLIRFDRYHNRGFALGRMKEHQEIVRGAGVAGTASLAASLLLAFARKSSAMMQTALSLSLFGALSNLYDRLVRGYVVDYLIIKKKPWSRLVINLGDAALFIGSILMILSTCFRKRK